jgi:hypothetical protein
MRKKPKTFRIDSRACATSMVKFSARSDSKNFPYKNRPSRGPINSQNFFFSYHHLKILRKDLYLFEFVLNFSFGYIFVLCHVANDFVTSLTPNQLNFLKNLNIVRKTVEYIFCSFESHLQNIPFSFRK